MEKLISMTDFVLEHKHMILSNSDKYIRISNYAKFLKQPLKLEMFVPCVNNEPLDEFIHNINSTTMSEDWNKAKETVLFEGCSTMQQGENTIVIFNDSAIWLTWTNRIVEDLIKDRVILTQNATKQFL